jgi:hypothetical protein
MRVLKQLPTWIQFKIHHLEFNIALALFFGPFFWGSKRIGQSSAPSAET